MGTNVSPRFLMQGAVYALEQCGSLLDDACCVYRAGSYGTAVALAAFAREELGRFNILLGLRIKALAGELVSAKDIAEECGDHVEKQKAGTLSMVQRADKSSGLGQLLERRFRAEPGSNERKSLDKELGKIDNTQFKRAPNTRHEKRIRALYVDPDDSGSHWKRPRDVNQTEAHEFLTHAISDYRGQLQKLDPDLGSDEQLLRDYREL
jgi:AbiV family abortive infection protein